MKDNKIRYYSSYDEDFFQIGKEYKLKKNYEYVSRNPLFYVLSAIVYFLALIFSVIYCKLFLRVKFVGRKKLGKEKRGFFLYGNHTHPIGDVFNPGLMCFPKRVYSVVSVLNMHLPVIGRLLRPLGAIPVPDRISGIRKFTSAINKRYSEGHPIVIYPEAHLWDYYTHIRPFSDTPFRYPAELNAPVYSFTTTYQKRRFGKKPKITIYIDGPFSSDADEVRTRSRELCEKCTEAMKKRAKLSTYQYVRYEKREKTTAIDNLVKKG